MRWALALGRTPRELLAGITNADIVEMMAFERMEPFGALHEELMFGQVCAAITNPHMPKGKSSKATDFMPALRAALNAAPESEPTLLVDPEAQAALIKASIFRVRT